MALVVVPSAIFSLLLATAIYRNRLGAIQTTEISTIADYATRTMIWFRGAQRALAAGANGVLDAGVKGEACARLAEIALRSSPDFRAIWFSDATGRTCAASDPKFVSLDQVDAIAATQSAAETYETYRDVKFAPSRLAIVEVKGAPALTVYVRSDTSSARGWRAMLMVAPDVLDTLLSEGATRQGALALVGGPNALFLGGRQDVADRAPDRSWLPGKLAEGTAARQFRAASAGGAVYSYAAAPVIASGLSLVTRFGDDDRQRAWMLFLTLTLAPLAIMAIMYLVYARAIRQDVMHWIYGIKAAALARIADPNSKTLALVGPGMPRELRRVAEAFNEMVTDHAVREERLRATLADNEFLTRELHHRIKNSLQVIQSYLSLSERLRSGKRRDDLLETAARVQVLSIAYRLALADGKMRPIAVAPFCLEVVNTLKASLRRSTQWISIEADVDAILHVDRAIPFGLAIVEAIIAGLHSEFVHALRVEVSETEDRLVTLRIVADGSLPEGEPDPKILRGLLLQLEASMLAPAEGELLVWRFAAV